MSRNRNRNKIKPLIISIVDIIIPVFNRSDLLKQCLEHIPAACNNNKYTVYVFDNGSSQPEENKTIRNLCSEHKAVYLHSSKNLGFPAGCNEGFRKGTSPLVFFLNDDVFLSPNSIDLLINVMDDPKIGVSGMRLLFPLDSQDQSRPPGKIQHVGLSTNIRGDFFHQFSGWSPENPRTFNIKNPYAVTGAAMITRRKLFAQAGGFFNGYGLGTYEDVDYCLTIREMGYNIYIEHNSIGFHLTGATVTSQNMGYPLGANRDIFNVRWKNKIAYTEWENW